MSLLTLPFNPCCKNDHNLCYTIVAGAMGDEAAPEFQYRLQLALMDTSFQVRAAMITFVVFPQHLFLCYCYCCIYRCTFLRVSSLGLSLHLSFVVAAAGARGQLRVRGADDRGGQSGGEARLDRRPERAHSVRGGQPQDRHAGGAEGGVGGGGLGACDARYCNTSSNVFLFVVAQCQSFLHYS